MNINIIGAGLAGMSAAITLAKQNIPCNLISLMPSERAQSVLAEGGINGALDTMGEDDNTENHYNDTIKAGVFIADREAVYGLTANAPGIIRELARLGVPFNMTDGDIRQRNFGGQKKKRTAFAKSSTGKIIMSALTDECRRWEAKGLVTRYPHHELIRLKLTDPLQSEDGEKTCLGAYILDTYSGKCSYFPGIVILAFGGLNGFFPHKTTGTTPNTGSAAARIFCQGVRYANLEMIQYHPTTMGIAGKRCLVSEAARGEGGRLFIERNSSPWYFMEELHPELGNLSPRDVVSREMYFVSHRSDCADQVYLDMRHLPEDVWKNRLPDLREEIMHYLGLDPKDTPVPVTPGIHYFMGGIDVDKSHRTNVSRLFAAGECCMQYHGANRLGGNSMLGAIYGGRVAAESAAELSGVCAEDPARDQSCSLNDIDVREPSPNVIREVSDIMTGSMGIVRNGRSMEEALEQVIQISGRPEILPVDRERIWLIRAMILSALYRKESRGAHYREDYPEGSDEYKGTVTAEYDGKNIITGFRAVPEEQER